MQVSIQKIPTRNTKYQNNIIASKLTNFTVITSSESKLEDILDKEFERMNMSFKVGQNKLMNEIEVNKLLNEIRESRE